MAINIDIDLNQSDWLRNTTWDIKPPTLNRLYDVLGITVAPFDVQKQKLGEFLLTPAAGPMPKTLLDQIVNVFVKKDLVEKAITLPDHIADQFPIIPDDDVIVIDIPEYLEKLIGLLGRVMQLFQGNPGFWVTRFGKRLFLKAKGNRLTDFLEGSLAKGKIAKVEEKLAEGIHRVTMENGLKGVFRRNSLRQGPQEIQAYKLSKELGWDDLVPVSVPKSSKGVKGLLGEGSLQHFAPGKFFAPKIDPLTAFKGKGPGPELAAQLRQLGSRKKLPTVSSNDIGRAATFDYLTGTTDRHAFNYLIQGKKLKLIDHEDIFPLPKRTSTAGPSSGGMFHPTLMTSDLFFEAVKRKVPLKTAIKDVNKVDWDKILRKLGIRPDTAASRGFFQRLRLLREGAGRGDDFSSLAGTPLFPKATDTIVNVNRFPILPNEIPF